MYRKFFKRTIDLVVGLLAFLVLLPFLLIIMILLWISTHGRAMFIQERVGYGCKKFKVIKFRTMTNAKDSDGNLLPDDDRLFPLGNFMRRFSVDELPQLLNVIKGDMSLVGPRPLIKCQIVGCSKQELRRHWVKPGMTGLAQINGRQSVSFRNRFRYDVWYVKNYSFRVDMMIIYHTVRMMLGLDKDRNIIYDPSVVSR